MAETTQKVIYQRRAQTQIVEEIWTKPWASDWERIPGYEFIWKVTEANPHLWPEYLDKVENGHVFKRWLGMTLYHYRVLVVEVGQDGQIGKYVEPPWAFISGIEEIGGQELADLGLEPWASELKVGGRT